MQKKQTEKRKAIIIGSSGQDGTLLYDLLEDKGYSIIGIGRESVKHNLKTRNSIPEKIDIISREEVFNLIKDFCPDEIYHLAAVHSSSENKNTDNLELFKKSYDVNVLSLVNFLEAVNTHSKKSKVFYAASCHIFRPDGKNKQDENTRIDPINTYGLTKAYGLLACRNYRNNYGISASTGILYNHESAMRDKSFLSKKIILGAIEIKSGKKKELVLGDLDARLDMGYAPDYVNAMHLILNSDNLGNGDEFIISTGETHSVREFVEIVFRNLGLDWKRYVKSDKGIINKSHLFIGDNSKLIKKTGWKRNTSFEEMILEILEKTKNTKEDEK